jgi:hypothetical protein
LIVPKAAFHVTALLLVEPCTLAENVSVPPVIDEAGEGKTVTEVTEGPGFVGVGVAVTVIVAAADFVLSATLVAVTTSVPVFLGAVYTPAAVIVPSAALHVTALSDAEPRTVALKDCVPPVATEALAGVIVTNVTAAPPPGGGALGVEAAATVTTADADFVGSATLVAVTIPLAAVAGAV